MNPYRDAQPAPPREPPPPVRCWWCNYAYTKATTRVLDPSRDPAICILDHCPRCFAHTMAEVMRRCEDPRAPWCIRGHG